LAYLRNAWYVVGWSHDLVDRPIAITVMNEPMVVYRGTNGIHALEDRCPHRHLPLSMGEVEGDAIRCGYHGMAIGSDGACINVPGQAGIPPRACIRSYPATERYGWVWTWMGEPALADEALIPDFSKLVDPKYRAVGKTNRVHASYQLLIDNLMDLSHAAFVHKSTIGTPGPSDTSTLKSHRTEYGVNVLRTVPNVPVPPTYVRSGVIPAHAIIDRWQVIDYIAPAFVQIHVGGAVAGTGALEGRYEHGFNMWVMNAATPESEHVCHYFWASVRMHALEDEAVDALLLGDVAEAFEEDKRVLEAQQIAILRHGDSWANALRADTGSVESRRVLEQRINAEQHSVAVLQNDP
jgi:phenylpropionate dioxygenase-like ring-hydroxylating dioxygenase large terminal subunit